MLRIINILDRPNIFLYKYLIMRTKIIKKIKTRTDFIEYFKEEEICIKYITQIRFKNGKFCPFCGCKKIYIFSNGKIYKCSECLKKFSIRVGTILENSKIPLKTWLLGIFLLSTSKNGIASTQFAHQLQVTQKTAWYMNNRIKSTYKRNKKIMAKKILHR